MTRPERTYGFLDAMKKMVLADQRFEPQPREALLRANGFQARDGDVDAFAAQPSDDIAQYFRPGVVNFDDCIRLDHYEPDARFRQRLKGLLELVGVEERQRRLQPDDAHAGNGFAAFALVLRPPDGCAG